MNDEYLPADEYFADGQRSRLDNDGPWSLGLLNGSDADPGRVATTSAVVIRVNGRHAKPIGASWMTKKCLQADFTRKSKFKVLFSKKETKF